MEFTSLIEEETIRDYLIKYFESDPYYRYVEVFKDGELVSDHLFSTEEECEIYKYQLKNGEIDY